MSDMDDEPSAPRDRLRLEDLARLLGVSRTTVSNAFSRPDQLSGELRGRVLDAARRAGYAGPDPVARMLRTGRAGAIGLVLPEPLPFALDDPTTSALVRGIADACEERRLGLLIVPAALRTTDPRTITEVAVDGFIAYSLPRDAAVLEMLLARSARLVVVDEPRLPGVATISVDDHGGAREAARHVAGLGHRRFAILALPLVADGYTGLASPARIAAGTYDVTEQRLQGYRAGLADAGVDPDGVPVFECAHSDEELGRNAVRAFLESDTPPTAVLAMSDRLALGALAAARDLRVPVPGRLSVVGFDDIDGAARSRPSLTTVRQPLRLKGYAAARLLLDSPQVRRTGRTTATPGPAPDALDLPVELMIRRSTGPAS
jgi:DNA-binding LacI/PurR family transcriptional regulator